MYILFIKQERRNDQYPGPSGRGFQMFITAYNDIDSS